METTNVGEAYGFFDSGASKAVIQVELPTILQRVGSPNGLEVSLMKLKDLEKIKVDPDLLQLIKESEIYPIIPSKYKDQMKTVKPIKIVSLKYVIKAIAKLENEKVADELGMIINGVYETYGNKDIFYSVIAWKEKGEYCLSA